MTLSLFLFKTKLQHKNSKTLKKTTFCELKGIGGGCLLEILSPWRGTNSKWGAYLKLGANSSTYGTHIMSMHEIIFIYLNCGLKQIFSI